MRLPLVLAGAACLASAIVIGPWPEDRAAMGRLQRLAGPLGSVAASTQWMRFTLATRSDDGERALGIGRSALGMDPLAPDGWQLLAHHLVFERGSDAESAGTRGRRVWIEAGLDLLEQGAAASREPGVLLYDLGLVAMYLGTLPPGERPWDGCQAQLVTRAVRAFEGAREAGHRGAPRALADALETAAALGIAAEGRGTEEPR